MDKQSAEDEMTNEMKRKRKSVTFLFSTPEVVRISFMEKQSADF